MSHEIPHRSLRVADLILHELSRLLLFEVRNPRLHHLTLTQVRMTADLKEARVYYDCDEDRQGQALIADDLNRAAPFLRRSLARVLSLRTVPALRFYFDETRILVGHAGQILDRIDD